jgi:hypothetical protein
MELHPDFKEFLQLLGANRVEYLVVGGSSHEHIEVSAPQLFV